MSPAIPLLLMSTLALVAGVLWPRAGQGVILVLGPSAAPAGAFGAPNWRIRSVSEFGPVTVILAMPETADADPAPLRRAAGAALAVLASPRGDCARP